MRKWKALALFSGFLSVATISLSAADHSSMRDGDRHASKLHSPSRTAKVTGKVFLDENGDGKPAKEESGLENVWISNGRDFVRSNKDGTFSIPAFSRFVFIIKPSGYKVTTSWYFDLEKSDDRICIGLQAREESSDFLFVQFNDSHFTQFEGDSQSEYLLKLVQEIIPHMDPMPVLLLAMGDLVDASDYPQAWSRLRNIVEKSEIPCYPAIGNHEECEYCAGELINKGKDTYSDYFGPTYYGLKYANFNFIILDALTRKGKYVQYNFPEHVLKWLAKYLRLCVGRKEPVVVSFHQDLPAIVNSNKLLKMLEIYNTKLITHGHGPVGCWSYKQIPRRAWKMVGSKIVNQQWQWRDEGIMTMGVPGLKGSGRYGVFWLQDGKLKWSSYMSTAQKPLSIREIKTNVAQFFVLEGEAAVRQVYLEGNYITDKISVAMRDKYGNWHGIKVKDQKVGENKIDFAIFQKTGNIDISGRQTVEIKNEGKEFYFKVKITANRDSYIAHLQIDVSGLYSKLYGGTYVEVDGEKHKFPEEAWEDFLKCVCKEIILSPKKGRPFIIESEGPIYIQFADARHWQAPTLSVRFFEPGNFLLKEGEKLKISFKVKNCPNGRPGMPKAGQDDLGSEYQENVK